MPDELARRVSALLDDVQRGVFDQDAIGNTIRDLVYIIRNRKPPPQPRKERTK